MDSDEAVPLWWDLLRLPRLLAAGRSGAEMAGEVKAPIEAMA
ncbi:MAG: hypothetical protein ACT4OS_09035 [Acidimicrobiales bacterium]